MEAFQTFFRQHSEHWIERFQYKEAGPQLLLQAILQRTPTLSYRRPIWSNRSNRSNRRAVDNQAHTP